jgi:hypothetical protein
MRGLGGFREPSDANRTADPEALIPAQGSYWVPRHSAKGGDMETHFGPKTTSALLKSDERA